MQSVGGVKSRTMAKRNVSLRRDSVQDQGTRVKPDIEFESAESALEREQAEADAHTPDWDLVSRITTAEGALAHGVPAEIVRKAYGEQVFAAATAVLNQRRSPTPRLIR
jgi:hypothetical protein